MENYHTPNFSQKKWRAGNQTAEARAKHLRQKFSQISGRQKVRKRQPQFMLLWLVIFAGFGYFGTLYVQPEKPSNRFNSNSVYFQNCSQARAAGRAPLLKGQPGYRVWLDADRDGIACEPIPLWKRVWRF